MQLLHQGQISSPLAAKLNDHALGSILTLADSTMLCVWSGDHYAHICPFGRALVSRSTDGGYPCTAENDRGELVPVYYQNNPGQSSQIYSSIRKVN